MQLKLNLIAVASFVAAYDNSVSAYNPQMWARESIEILRERMMIPRFVNQDFSSEVREYGDTVHTRKPANFVAKRKIDSEPIVNQDAAATNVSIVLNQHSHVSFTIKDGQMARSFKDLVRVFLRPAMNAQAKLVDQVLLAQVAQSIPLGYTSGQLRNISSTTARNYIVDARRALYQQLAPDDRRAIFWAPTSEAELLKTDLFTAAYATGDGGTALEQGLIGKKFGFQNYLAQDVPSVTYTAPITGAVNLAAGYNAGTTTMVVDGLSAAIGNGTFFTVAGDDTPQRVVSTSGGATPVGITFTPGLKRAVVNDAVIKIYTPVAVNFAAGYIAGWHKDIVYTGTPVLQVGQMVSFKTDPTLSVYTIVQCPSSTSIILDRPLDAAIADTDKINMGPQGDYNIALHPNAMTLVIRPMPLPDLSTGVRGAIATDEETGLSMRVVMTYDGTNQGHLVTLDFLFGVKVLDAALMTALLG